MPFSVLQDYLSRLSRTAGPDQRIWLGDDGRVQGQFFNCTLTSVFQPVRRLDCGEVVAHEAFVQSYSASESGLSLWKLLDRAASDDESINLDRLCRMLHVLNFYRQSANVQDDLYLSVHGRLLAAVGSNHGMVFRRIVDSLGLPVERILLQLPQATPNQGWLLNYVIDNYRRNGFRVAINAANAADGLRLLETVRPEVIKLDARQIGDPAGVEALLLKCRSLGVRLVFKRVESGKVVDLLAGLPAQGHPVLVQGYAWDLTKGAIGLRSASPPSAPHRWPAAIDLRSASKAA